MNSPQRIAVFGGGHLGTIHARLVRQVPNAELVAIVEPSSSRATELAADFDCEITTDVDGFVARAAIDGAVIAAPTTLHHELGVKLLDRGIHCLIEKPLASTPVESRALVLAARRSGCVLQVGHVERFNPAWTTIQDQMGEPRFIEATREGTLTFRSMDAGVVLDLMIHDIDLVLSLVRAPVVHVEAVGFHWTGESEDIAHARLIFGNGCEAQLKASRVSSKPRRQMRIYGPDWFGDVDFGDRTCQLVAGPRRKDWQQRTYSVADRERLISALYDEVLTKRDLVVPDGNPILDELADFVTSILTQTPPIVTGEDGASAVDIAHQIIDLIQGGSQRYRKAG